MAIYLRNELTRRLIRERYGNVDGLVVEWEYVKSIRPAFPKPREKAAIFRWLNEGVPTRGQDADQVFGLCALLDIDLLTIFDYERNGYFSRFGQLRHLIYITSLLSSDGLETFMRMYRPADNWPSDPIAEACYGHPWFGSQLANEDAWRSADYILVKAKFSGDVNGKPRAVHVAYRRVGLSDTAWRYYGTVIAVDGELKLYNESGGHQKMPQVEANEIRFRTYYGGRPVEWRVASLHDFAPDFEMPFNDMNTIGFNW